MISQERLDIREHLLAAIYQKAFNSDKMASWKTIYCLDMY